MNHIANRNSSISIYLYGYLHRSVSLQLLVVQTSTYPIHILRNTCCALRVLVLALQSELLPVGWPIRRAKAPSVGGFHGASSFSSTNNFRLGAWLNPHVRSQQMRKRHLGDISEDASERLLLRALTLASLPRRLTHLVGLTNAVRATHLNASAAAQGKGG